MNTKAYWRIRNILRNIWFQVRTVLFKGLNCIVAYGEYGSLRSLIYKKAIACSLQSGAIATVVYVVDNWLINRYDVVPLDHALLNDVAICGIGVAGVILGLYCANIISLYTTKYADAPEVITRVFYNDKITQRSITSIIQYIGFCLIVIAELLLDIDQAWLTGIVIIVWSMIVVVAYCVAGSRAYKLANIYALVEDSSRELSRIVCKYLAKGIFISMAPLMVRL